MKQYPSIPKIPQRGVWCYVFAKQDGSQIRVEWSAKKGYHRWGRRGGLLDDSNPILKRAPTVWEVHPLAQPLEAKLREERIQEATLYFEFWGASSFAGNHSPDDEQTLTLFDIDVKRKGLMAPKDFYRLTFGLPGVAECLHHGAWTADIEDQVRAGTLPGMPFEGVVAKVSPDRNGEPIMWKCKSDAWLAKLKHRCGDNEALFNQLA